MKLVFSFLLTFILYSCVSKKERLERQQLELFKTVNRKNNLKYTPSQVMDAAQKGKTIDSMYKLMRYNDSIERVVDSLYRVADSIGVELKK